MKNIIITLIAVFPLFLFTGCEENGDCAREYYVKYKVTAKNATHLATLELKIPSICKDDDDYLKILIDSDFEGEFGPYFSGDEVYMSVYGNGLDVDEYTSSVYVKVDKDGVYNLVETSSRNIDFILK